MNANEARGARIAQRFHKKCGELNHSRANAFPDCLLATQRSSLSLIEQTVNSQLDKFAIYFGHSLAPDAWAASA